MKILSSRFAVTLVVLGLIAGQGHAGLVTFTGEDLGAGPGGTFTNSNAAAANFLSAASALGNVGTITFESAPTGSFTNLTVAPGVTINGSDQNGAAQQILNAPVNGNLDGFNITPGGSQFVEQHGGTLTFTFAQGTQFFGTYLTGIQTVFFTDTITFNDGTSESITVPGSGTSSSIGAVAFVGFTDAGKSITSITINTGVPNSTTSGQDYIGVDNVSYQAIPEPSSLALCCIAAAAGACYARARRPRTAAR